MNKNRKVLLIICLPLFLGFVYLLSVNLPRCRVAYLIDNLYEKKCRDKLYESARENPKIVLDVILEKIDSIENPKDKITLIQLIGWLKNEKSEKILLNYLDDPLWEIRFFSVKGLSGYDSKEVNDRLLNVLERETYWPIRREIIIILTNRRNSRLGSYLIKELDSDDRRSVILANLCLYILKGDSKYFNFIKDLLFETDSDDNVFKKKYFCVWTIGDLRNRLYVDLLEELRAQTTEPKLSETINSSLEKIAASNNNANEK